MTSRRATSLKFASVVGVVILMSWMLAGDARNPFGLTVEGDFLTAIGFSGNVLWGPELAALDSDGDGFTNGEELGDPLGAWQPGDPAPIDAADVTLPGDPESHPPEPEVPTAVAPSTWARVKAAAGKLLN